MLSLSKMQVRKGNDTQEIRLVNLMVAFGTELSETVNVNGCVLVCQSRIALCVID